MTKAETALGGEITQVTAYSKVYASADMANVIEEIDRDATPANRDQATSLAAVLIGKCRAHGLANGPIDGVDFKLYASGLGEAFMKFPASVGLQAIDGGTGLPSKSAFWPKPFDVVTFCDTIMAKRARAKVMAQRHMAEAQRREEERATPEIDYTARAAHVAATLAKARLRQMDGAA